MMKNKIVKIVVKVRTEKSAELLMNKLSQSNGGAIGNIKKKNDIIVIYNAN